MSKNSQMTKSNYELIAMSVWRSGYVPDKNQVRQQARESMRRLIAIDLASSLQANDPKFDRNKFLESCGIEADLGEVAQGLAYATSRAYTDKRKD